VVPVALPVEVLALVEAVDLAALRALAQSQQEHMVAAEYTAVAGVAAQAAVVPVVH
jgi:hypothetical protein